MDNLAAEIINILSMDMESFANLQEMAKVPTLGSDEYGSPPEQELWQTICSLVDSGGIVALFWDGQAYNEAKPPIAWAQRSDYWFARARDRYA